MTLHITDLAEPIKKAARTVAFQWPGVVDEQDMSQMLWLHLSARAGSVEKILNEMDDKTKLNAIIRVGHQLAAQERTDYEVFTGNFRYSVNEVKSLLEDRALHNDDPELGSNWSIADDFIQGGEFEDAVLRKSSSEIDLKRGMARLRVQNEKYAEAIDSRYLRSTPTGEIDRKQLHRALTALTTEMNRSFKRQHAERLDGPGSRRAISNAGARVISTHQYHGDYGDGRW